MTKQGEPDGRAGDLGKMEIVFEPFILRKLIDTLFRSSFMLSAIDTVA